MARLTSLELSIAWRYLRSRRGSRLLSFISVIAIGGVIVGVSALILIIGVMTGLQNDLREKILIGSPDLRVLTYGEDLRMAQWDSILKLVKRHPGITAAAPFVLTQGLVSAGHDYREGAIVVGIEPQRHGVAEVTGIRHHAKGGDFSFRSRDGETRGVVLGQRIADRLNVFPGDSITIISAAGAKMNAALGGIVPRLFSYEVTGVFQTGMYEYDNTYIYMSLASAQEFAGLGQAVTGIEAKTEDRWSASEIGKDIASSLSWPYRVMDWQEQNSSLFQALKLEKLGMGIILLLIVIVAAFNIVSTLSMVVKDRTREIGILKAMGLPARSVRRVFFAQGLVIGLVGTGLGVILGLGAALIVDHYELVKINPEVYFIDHLPVTVDLLDVLWIVVMSMAIAAVATLYPAIQAARLYPVEAIRHE